MPWLRRFVRICAYVMAGVVAALVLLVSLVDLGLSTDGIVALFLGALGTIAIGMALMGLVFYSQRLGDRVGPPDSRRPPGR